ncbi:MAG: hypothetical protein Q8L69_07970 [Gallionellaceae bacterium]|nr:hypothetical protein [Gallionellaceae bacterium]
MSTFDSTKRLLPEILAEIVKAKIQLPAVLNFSMYESSSCRGDQKES